LICSGFHHFCLNNPDLDGMDSCNAQHQLPKIYPRLPSTHVRLKEFKSISA
jgi:hypothetical protein